MANKKLIEVALPLEKINEAAAYEKMPGIGPHPRGIHLWWARRPLTTARAVIWSSLVDDPSSHPDKFPTEEEQVKERLRLFGILEELVDWKNSKNEEIINKAKAEIEKSNNSNLPILLDPFSGGGAIPLEAQRLGLEAHAHDLNPVAVMINKSMIEIPSVFSDNQPVNPRIRERAGGSHGYVGSRGIAEDVKYYGEEALKIVTEKIGHMYPKMKIREEESSANIVSWLWTRIVKCPNPACGSEMPLARSFTLCKKKGKKAWVEPIFFDGEVSFEVHNDGKPKIEGTVNRKGAICACCGTPVAFSYIRDEGKAGRLNAKLSAVVVEGKRTKLYVTPDEEQRLAADVPYPEEYPNAEMANNPRNFNTPIYGMNHFADLFTRRQLTAISEFSKTIKEIREKIEKDAINAGMRDDGISMKDGGDGAAAYAEAIIVYLSFAVDRVADFSTSVSRWAITNEKAMNCFSKQAIAMTWDYPEVNVLGTSVGSFSQIIGYITECINTLPHADKRGVAQQKDAQTDCGLRNIVVSTDPPYYDNIDYADLADFFYIWMRQSLKDIYPQLFQTMVVPKAEELVATPYRFDGSTEKAKQFFEDGMLTTCKQIYKYASDEIPVTIYYAYKQSETDEGNDSSTASTGWETMLSAIIKAGFSITGTWPMRTEQAYRVVSMGTNALASSIVLVCRKRGEDAAQITRRNFINVLKRELRPALKKLQRSNIAPVDLAQSAIGPGMGVFSKYSSVLEADGTIMTVRSALQIINQEIDLYFNEQDSVLDRDSRFCVDIFSQYAFNDVKFGDADTLARAKNTSVASITAQGIVYAQKGIVHLIERNDLSEKIDERSCSWLLCQQLTRAMENSGIEGCAKLIAPMFGEASETAKDLAYRLYTISERKGWAQEAYAYNALVVSWPEIQSRAAAIQAVQPKQMTLFDM